MPFDLRLAFRSLRRQPVLAAAIVLTVGLAVAGNAALFSIFDGLLYRPLPYADADRIVHVALPVEARRMMPREAVASIDAALQDTPVFERRGTARAAVLLEDGAADVAAWGLRPSEISPGLLRMLAVVPAAGRLLSEDDGGAAPQRAMLGFDLWQARFGGSPAIIGTAVEVPGVILRRRLEVVGVMPRGFAFPDGANLWVPAPATSRAFNFARLAPGISVDKARGALPGVEVTPLRQHLQPDGAAAFGMLLVATGCLLLVAWVQVAGLLFARAAGRASEIGVRLALGASRARLVRQFAIEGAVLAIAALVVAWMLAPGLTAALVSMLPDAITRGQQLAPDARTLLFSVAISVAGIVLLAVVPADIVRRSAPVDLVTTGAFGRVTTGATRTRLIMLAVQLAVTTTLIYMSGLAMRSFDAIGRVDLGFDPGRIVAVQLPPTTVAGSTTDERRAHLARQVEQWSKTLEALRGLPGVAAAAGGRMPFRSSILFGGAGMPVTSPGLSMNVLADYGVITPDYVRVMRLTIVEGSVPDEDDLPGMGPQAVINEAMARELATPAAIGGQLTVNNRTATIAAVVGDFKTTRPDLPVAPTVLLLQRRPQGGYVLARIDPAVSLEEALAGIRATMDRVWPANPSREVLIVSDFAARAIADYRARAVLLGLIGALCLPLAFTGIAGGLSYAVGQRTREIGIRMALGAAAADIRRTVLGRGLLAVAGGLAAGLGGGVLVGGAMSAFLFGVGAADLATIGGVSLVLLATALGAMAIPIRRALSVTPADALRSL